ncbi:MAG: hypothetical protein ACJ76X_14010 [Solirubrobacteraceae bacterium]
MTEELDQTAQQIADRGREALIERLRPAFRDAAAQHADVLELNDEQLEQMVERAADRADGLQWRRALASVATEELGIGLGEALSHPAVERAQMIVGAPSYEESLAALTAKRQAEADAAAEPDEPEGLDEEEEADEPEPLDEEPEADEPEPLDEEPEADEPEPLDEPGSIRVAVIHLGGVANLEPGEGDIELRLSEVGLDIVRGTDETLGRLTWEDIHELTVPAPRGLIRRRRDARAHLVIRTENGDASFEVLAVAADEVRDQLAPLIERHGRTIVNT